jgi:exoribonuclease II
MLERNLLPDFAAAVLDQLAHIVPSPPDAEVADLRNLPWCSIDNDDSRDLDQLTVWQPVPAGGDQVLIAVADVDAFVAPFTPIDDHAARNTTSVYTAAQVFSMLPERLSTDLTSLNPGQDRLGLVIGFIVGPDGAVDGATVQRARVRSQAKLTYDAVAAWLDDAGALPAAAARVPGLDQQLRRQDQVAARLRQRRRARGALELQSLEARPVFDGETVVALEPVRPNRARELIADFMIAANTVAAGFLEAHGRPSVRRVVRSPERWNRLQALAARHGEVLPDQPSTRALEEFIDRRRAADPLHFPDLSLAVVKLMGRGEYVAEAPGQEEAGHFGLGVQQYAHATAPNRRFPDLVNHRLMKAVLTGQPAPYDLGALTALAEHCSQQESNAARVERSVRKSAAVLLIEHRVGQTFAGIVTAASPKGTYLRTFDPPLEGRIVRGAADLAVGDKTSVTLVGTDFEKGFIDFAR